MRLWDKIRGYLQPGPNRRKVLIGGVVTLAILGLIIFGANLDSLLSRLTTRAGIQDDLAKTWKDLEHGSAARAHAKSIVVEQGGKTWLYVIGGLETYTAEGQLRSKLLNTVERIEINPQDGSPAKDGVWHTMRPMNTGHAEFGILQTTVNFKPYIYVVAGDIHIPPVDEADQPTNIALLYSTMERLDLSADNAAWEFVGNLTGVNFYPEVTMFDGKLNVVGGIYGNPFGGSPNCGDSSYGAPGTNRPLDPIADVGLWDTSTSNLPTIGPSNPILPIADTGQTIITGSVSDTGTDTGGGTPPGPVVQAKPKRIARIPAAYAFDYTEMKVVRPEAGIILTGNGENKYPIVVEIPAASGPDYYNSIRLSYRVDGGDWIDINTYSFGDFNGIDIDRPAQRYVYNDWVVPNVRSSNVQVKAELFLTIEQKTSLVRSALSGQFSINMNVAQILSDVLLDGSFVTTVSEHYTIDLSASPITSRASELGNTTQLNDPNLNDFAGTFNTSWKVDGINRLGHLRFKIVDTRANPAFGAPQYKAISVSPGRYGHKLFINDSGKLVVVGGAIWVGSAGFSVIEDAANSHIAYTLSKADSFWSPSSLYAVNASSGSGSKGRAFFGLAKSGEELMLIGGLENGDGKVQPTSRVSGLQTNGWAERDEYASNDYIGGLAVYNLSAFGMNDRLVAYGGQTEFCSNGGVDPHVPDPTQPASNTNSLYQDSGDVDVNSWHRMASFGSPYDDPKVKGTGLTGKYFNLSNDNYPVITRIDPTVDFDWGLQSPSEDPYIDPSQFIVKWTGLINIRQTGMYRFKIGADDYADFSLDLGGSEKFRLNDQIEGYNEVEAHITINQTGLYQVSLNYRDDAGSFSQYASVRLFWQTPGTNTFSIIPSDSLYPEPGDGAITNGISNVVFSADTIAAGTIDKISDSITLDKPIHNFYIYRYGGFKQQSVGTVSPYTIKNLQGLGSFTDAESGVPYIPNSSFIIEPRNVTDAGIEQIPIAADGYAMAKATVTLKDYYGKPVLGKHVTVYEGKSDPWPPGDTDDVTVTPLGDAGRDAGFDEHYIKTNDQGVAQFSLTSTKANTYHMLAAWSSVPTHGEDDRLEGVLGDIPIVFTDEGVPSQVESTITVDKPQVVADHQDTATITVTLRDKNRNPLPGITVSVTSNRNIGRTYLDYVDTIVAGSLTRTNANGEVYFAIKSNTKGPAVISGSYEASQGQGDTYVAYNIPLLDTANVTFVGKIWELDPDSAYQGDELSLTAKGVETSWKGEDPDKTEVSFAPPADFSISTDRGYILDANGVSKTNLTATVTGKPNTSITIEIFKPIESTFEDGWGYFLPSGNTKVTVITDISGKATVVYRHGWRTGVIGVKISVNNTIPLLQSSNLVLVLANLGNSRTGLNPYEVQVTANPVSLTDTASETAISAMLYRYGPTGRIRIFDPGIEVHFRNDDNGSLTEIVQNIDETQKASTTYRRGNHIGDRHVFATISYQGYLLAGLVTIHDTSSATGVSFGTDGLTITNNNITISNVVVDEEATPGYWNFVTTTKIGVDDLGNPEFETITHPFEVLDANAPTRSITLAPTFVYAPSTDATITITGNGTNFFPGSSKVFFTHSSDPNGTGITYANSDVIVDSPTVIRVVMDVATAATLGYWDVKVETDNGTAGIETVSTTGFLVTTSTGYQFAITASPNEIIRDSDKTSQLTTKVGRIDNATGVITPLSGVTLTYSLEGGTGGSLQKITGTTDANGQATNVYTTDSGSESDEIYVRVSATIKQTPPAGDLPLTTRVMIMRNIVEGDYITLSANPTSLPLAGTPGDTSNLTATVVGLDGHPVPDGIMVNFLVQNGSGTINPAGRKTSSGGVATSTYYRADNLTVPTSSTIVAKATIPDVGTVFSEPVIINIGADDQDYNLTFVADKTSIPVGGSDKAKLTATLSYKGVLQKNYPFTFQLTDARSGDYLTVISGSTDSQGKLVTEFVAGNYAGYVMVTATPIGLFSKSVVITKTSDSVVDPHTSTLSVVPAYLPADNTSTGLVTVTLRNDKFTPLSGKSVTVASDRSGDIFSPTGSQLTNANGQVFFTIKSGTIGTSNVKATVGTLILGPAQVKFEDPAGLISVKFDIKVPLEAKSYDREIMLYLREKTTGLIPTIQQVYLTDAANDKITGLPETIYLHPAKQYGLWAKGHYHLARVRNFTSPAASGSTVTLDFTNSSDSKGLYIADLSSGSASEIFPGFNDNKINAIDVAVMSSVWGKNSYIADFDGDSKVTTLDIAYWAANWFHNPGDPLP